MVLAAHDGTGTTELNTKVQSVGGTLVAVFDLSGTPGDITVNSSQIVANKSYKVLHFTGGQWTECAVKSVAAGSLVFHAPSFSPFAIVAVPAAASTSTSSAAVTSPKTSGFDAGMLQAGLSVAGTLSLLGVSGLRFVKIMK